VEADFALDVQGKTEEIIESLGLAHVDQFRVICMRSKGSTANAYARIWNLPKIWQKALGVKTYYIIEVISEKFDPLEEDEQEKIIIHELLHIPKTFSGALVPHECFGQRIDYKTVSRIHKLYKERRGDR